MEPLTIMCHVHFLFEGVDSKNKTALMSEEAQEPAPTFDVQNVTDTIILLILFSNLFLPVLFQSTFELSLKS